MATVEELLKEQQNMGGGNNSATNNNNAWPGTFWGHGNTTGTVNGSTNGAGRGQGSGGVTNTGNSNTVVDTYATETEKRINDMFDAQKDAQLKQLESAYNQNLADAEEAKRKIAPQYQTAANDLAVQHERDKRNLNQQIAMNGLNTGTGSQAALAQNSTFQRDYGNLRTSESEALVAADTGINRLKQQYQDGIAVAVADSDYKRAAALLDEYNTQYNREMQIAETLAQYGDFSGYAKFVGAQAAEQMKLAWITSNPETAYSLGYINDTQYTNLKMGLPMNYAGTVATSGGGAWDYGGSGWNPGAQLTVGDMPTSEYYAKKDLGLI